MKKGLSLLTLIYLASIIVLIQGCKKTTLPELITTEVAEISVTSAVSGGEITSDGGDEITARGVCWNTTGDPSITDPKTTDGTGAGIFSSTIPSLQSATTYFVRAYATNSVGTSYGEVLSFNTKIADVDGNQYAVVNISTQMWMAENLKTTRYKDNTSIPKVTGNGAWIALTTPAYCWYNDDEAYAKPLYGAIYNFYAVKSGKLCPTGWHVPTDAEYTTLEVTLGLPVAQIDVRGWRGTDQGKQLKNTIGWAQGENGTNTSGFSALPSGYRNYETGIYAGMGVLGYWWSATEPDAIESFYRRLDGDNAAVFRAAVNKKAGKSVRCVKD